MNRPDSSLFDEPELDPTHEMSTLKRELARVSDDVKNYGTRISKLESVQEKNLSRLSTRSTKLDSTRQEWRFPTTKEWEAILGFLFGCLSVSALAMILFVCWVGPLTLFLELFMGIKLVKG